MRNYWPGWAELSLKIEQMILAHERQFGKKPTDISMPMTSFVFEDVKITFHQAPGYFSTDPDHCFHHHFEERKNDTKI